MSHFQYQCCCSDKPDCTSCPTSNCPCNSSYLVNGISFTYEFTLDTPVDPPCDFCNSGCYSKSYSISLNFTQPTAGLVTRQSCPDEAASNRCGWYGGVELSCDYTVTVVEKGKCFGSSPSGGLNRTVNKTYTGTVDVEGCLHVTCQECAPHPSCGGALGIYEKAWHHTLEICDFPIACANVTIMGGQPADLSLPCGAGADCDWGATPYVPCDVGPASIRCIGGTISFRSKYVCLSTIGNDYKCRGWYNPLRCEAPCTGTLGNPPFSVLDFNVLDCGAFACVLDDECADPAQDPTDDGYCDKKRRLEAFLPTLVGDAALRAELQSFCGAVDTSVEIVPCAPYVYTIFQLGCPNLWTYT
jgi:hypothetical protein